MNTFFPGCRLSRPLLRLAVALALLAPLGAHAQALGLADANHAMPPGIDCVVPCVTCYIAPGYERHAVGGFDTPDAAVPCTATDATRSLAGPTWAGPRLTANPVPVRVLYCRWLK